MKLKLESSEPLSVFIVIYTVPLPQILVIISLFFAHFFLAELKDFSNLSTKGNIVFKQTTEYAKKKYVSNHAAAHIDMPSPLKTVNTCYNPT